MRRPVSEQIAVSILSDYIHSGRVRAGARLPTVRELEQHYGVSRATIVQALTILQQQGWVERRHGSGVYVCEPNPAQRGVHPRLIGYVARNTDSEVILRVYEGIERVARIHNMHVLVGSASESYEIERQQVRRMIEAGCQAVVLFPVSRTRAQLEADYLKREFLDYPIVLVDIAYPEQRRPQVVFDNYRLGYEMTEMLLHEGHRRIAFMDVEVGADRLMHYSTRERYRGYLDALQHAQAPVYEEDHWIMTGKMPGDDMANTVLPFLQRWRESHERPTALIALEDFAAMRTIQVAQALNIRIPEDLTVVGFDNLTTARGFSPPFPTSDPDFRRAGEVAARLCLQWLRGVLSEPVIYMLPVSLRKRRVVAIDGIETIHHKGG